MLSIHYKRSFNFLREIIVKKFFLTYMKHFGFGLLFFGFALQSFAAPSFNGIIGAGLLVQPEADFKLPDLSAEAFFASQIDISTKLLMRTEFSVFIDSIIGENFLKDIPAYFSINELSLNYVGSLGSITQLASVFIGETDPIGSDLLLRRLFGVPSFTSRILETSQSLSSAQLYPMSGLGASYTLKAITNIAGSVYFYYNKENIASTLPSSVEDTSLNIDFRLSGVLPWTLVDLSAGFTLPFEKLDADGEEVILLVRKANLHAGLSLFIGSSHTSSLLLQAGLIKLVISPNPNLNEKVVTLKDLTLLVEPRFKAQNLGIALSLFNIPPQVAKKLFYIENPLGVNVSLFYSTFAKLGFQGELGLHTTLSVPESTFELSAKDLVMQIAPYIKADIGGGSLNAAIKCKVFNFTSFSKAVENTSLSVGYKTQI